MKRTTVMGVLIGLALLALAVLAPVMLGEHRPPSDPPVDQSRF